MSKILVYTIGVYGYTEENFFEQLAKHNINTFVDIRRRRGMRGKRYSFVNSSYLQLKLKKIGIEYLYIKELSPTDEIRETQKNADQKLRTTKHTRAQLDSLFISKYNTECLEKFDFEIFLGKFNEDDNLVLFCVEENPEACHRSLVAKKMKDLYGITVIHL